MTSRRLSLLILLLCVGVLTGAAQAPVPDDALLRAMRAEVDRARDLRVVSLEPPYYIEYSVYDSRMLSIAATLGALGDVREEHGRLPRIRVRVGDYQFDNGNYIYTDSLVATRYALGPLPIDNQELALRQYFWLATDVAYKSALQAIARKQAAIRNLTVTDQIPDFAKAAPITLITPAGGQAIDREAWKTRVRSLSGLFTAYPLVFASVAEFQSNQGSFYFVNSEGSTVRVPEDVVSFQVRATALAPDGMLLRDSTSILAHDLRNLPAEPELRRATEAVAQNLTALARAPVGESYTGPVMFEPLAAAQLLADLFGRNLGQRRRPVTEPGRVISFTESEFEGRVGSRILPDWMDIVDDPTAKEWNGRPLFGNYLVDLDGVVPAPLTIVEKGFLRNMLATRQPVKGREGSNGRARLFASFGANGPAFGNLIVRATGTSTLAELKQKLIDLCRQSNKPYGLLIRKMDFPSTASGGELQRIAARMAQDGGGGRLVSLPLLVYRVYPDGREELLRGMRLKGVSTRSLRDIVAAGGDPAVFDYQENGAPFAVAGAASFVAECSIVAPGLLFEELQLERSEEEMPRLPIVPPPPLTAAR
jgi:predicted Zn-dependent protease